MSILDKYIKKNPYLFAFIIVGISNVFIYFSAVFAGVERFVINLDYFIPLVFLAFGFSRLYAITFVLFFILDFLIVFFQVFPILRLSDLLYLLKFSFISSHAYQIYGVLTLFILGLSIFLIKKIYNKKQNLALLLIFNVCTLVYVSSVLFLPVNIDKINFWKPKQVYVGSSGMSFKRLMSSAFLRSFNVEGGIFKNVRIDGATKEMWSEFKEYEKILLIVNESWGVPQNSLIQNDVLSPLLSLQNLKNVHRGGVDYTGYTIGGELRELCRIFSDNFNLRNRVDGFEDCLPNRYKSFGYNTIAVHGALGLMYDRQYWYPRAGFQEVLFKDIGLNLPHSRCYSFPGVCDKDIASVIIDKFKKNDKLFFYWLTLNTHSIYDKRDMYIDLFDCKKFQIAVDTTACRNLKLQKQFFYTLSQMLKHPALSGAKVIVVGDHEPPMIQMDNNPFIKSKVPTVIFEVQ